MFSSRIWIERRASLEDRKTAANDKDTSDWLLTTYRVHSSKVFAILVPLDKSSLSQLQEGLVGISDSKTASDIIYLLKDVLNYGKSSGLKCLYFRNDLK